MKNILIMIFFVVFIQCSFSQNYWNSIENINAGNIRILTKDADGNLYGCNTKGKIYRSSDKGNNWIKYFEFENSNNRYGSRNKPIIDMVVNSKGDIFLGCDDFNGGINFRVYKIDVKGILSEIATFFNYSSVHTYDLDLCLDSKDVLYCSVPEIGIFKSTNNGLTWKSIKNISGSAKLETDINDFLYIGFISGHKENGEIGILKSEDKGISFNSVYQSNFIKSITVNSENNIVVGLNDAKGIVISNDKGASWKTIYTADSPSLINYYDDERIYAYFDTDKMLYRFDNKGNYVNITFIEECCVTGMISLSKNSLILGITSYGFLKTDDAGSNWYRTNYFDMIVTSSACVNGKVYLLSDYYFTVKEGFYDLYELNEKELKKIYSFQEGMKGVRVNTKNNTVVVFGKNSIWKKEKNGNTFHQLSSPLGEITDLQISSLGKLYTIIDSKFFSSFDDGENFEYVGDCENGRILCNNTGDLLYIFSKKFTYSIDYGKSWVDPSSITSSNSWDCGIALSPNGYLFLGDYHGYFYKIIDKGASCYYRLPVSRLVNTSSAEYWNILSTPENKLFMSIDSCGKAQGIFRSGDLGDSWEMLNNGWNRRIINNMIMNDQGHLLLFTDETILTSIGKVTGISLNDSRKTLNNYTIYQNYPNPFNPTTKIHYELPKESFVSLKVYNIFGQEIETLQNGKQAAGYYEVVFDGTGLSSGLYFYKIDAESFRKTKKMMIIK